MRGKRSDGGLRERKGAGAGAVKNLGRLIGPGNSDTAFEAAAAGNKRKGREDMRDNSVCRSHVYVESGLERICWAHG